MTDKVLFDLSVLSQNLKWGRIIFNRNKRIDVFFLLGKFAA